MLFAEQNLYAFIHLLNHQPSVFSETDRKNLDKLCTPLEDNPDVLSNAIIVWCKENPGIHKTLRQTRKSLFLQSTQERAPGTQEGNVSRLEDKVKKENILNAVRQKPSPNNPPKSNR